MAPKIELVKHTLKRMFEVGQNTAIVLENSLQSMIFCSFVSIHYIFIVFVCYKNPVNEQLGTSCSAENHAVRKLDPLARWPDGPITTLEH